MISNKELLKIINWELYDIKKTLSDIIKKNAKYFLKNKKILITGATGSIGSSLVMKIFRYNNFKVIRAMSNDENGLSELLEDMDSNFKSFNLDTRMRKRKFRILYGDIRDYERCLSATKDIDIVIHAAAMKHVSICEYNPLETIKTNVEGTKILLRHQLKIRSKNLYLSALIKPHIHQMIWVCQNLKQKK